MAEPVLMLALSPTMEEGTIVNWHKQEGEVVAQNELLCEVETDKATMEYESLNEGTLLKVLVPAGGQAKVGEPIAVIGQAGEDIASLVAELTAKGEDKGAAGIPSTAAAMPSTAAAVPSAATAGASTAAAVPATVPGVPSTAPVVPSTVPAVASAVSTAPSTVPAGRIKASPLARKMAQELRVDLASIQGSGPGGRIVKRDLEVRPQGAPLGAAAGPGAPGAVPASGPLFLGTPPADERIALSTKRKVIARRLIESKFSAPHYYLKIDVAVDQILAARQAINRESGRKVSFNAFLLKFAAESLKRHRQVNAGLEEEAIVRYGRIDIGLAVAQSDGLITPVVRNCGLKGVEAIDADLQVLIDKARNNKLTPEEYSGATFTLSTLGSYGILEFTAIINPPGSAILAVGKIQKQPVVDEGNEIQIKSKMILTLSCDHRVIDGAVGAAFLADLKRMIEDPIRVLY